MSARTSATWVLRRFTTAPVRRSVKGGVRVSVTWLLSTQGRRVWHGPFRGMLIPTSASHSLGLQFLLGTHETELHSVIERLIAARFRTIVNCGANRGYYAIGFAVRSPDAHVVAFERDASFHPDLARAAQVNGVGDRVEVRGTCGADRLRDCLAAAQEPVLVVADIEGDELAVFDGATIGALSRATVLIETHERRVPGSTGRLLARFAQTHRVEVYTTVARARGDLPPALSSGRWKLLSPLVLWLIKEHRALGQQWVLFTPKATSGATHPSDLPPSHEAPAPSA